MSVEISEEKSEIIKNICIFSKKVGYWINLSNDSTYFEIELLYSDVLIEFFVGGRNKIVIPYIHNIAYFNISEKIYEEISIVVNNIYGNNPDKKIKIEKDINKVFKSIWKVISKDLKIV